MKKITLIHISDLHICKENIGLIEELLPRLIEDINSNKEGNIHFLLCSGDLVQSGTEENYNLAFDKFIIPLLDGIGIDEQSFIYVPGNHEVDISKIDLDFINGFTERILEKGFTREDVTKANVTERLKQFFIVTNSLFNNEWDQSDLISSKIFEKDGISWGVSRVNSAWNTCGDSKKETKQILLSREELVKNIDKLRDCDKKILVLHHPIDWFDDDNAAAIEPLFSKYDFVVSGHKHHGNCRFVQHMNGVTICNYASKVDISKGENGYSLICYDETYNKIKIKGRVYNKTRIQYTQNTNITDNGEIELQLKANTIKQEISNIILNSKNNFVKSLNNLFITNLLDSSSKKTFDSLFIMPKIDTFSQFIKEKKDKNAKKEEFDLDKILRNRIDVTFWGRKETGKTIFAHYLAKIVYEKYEELQAIPVVIDFKYLQTYKTAIIKEIHKKINELVDDKNSVSLEKIKDIATAKGFVIIFDNFTNSTIQNEQINEFKEKYPNNHLIYFCEEMPAIFSEEDKKLMLDNIHGESTNFFIRDMDKHSIRLLAKNMTAVNSNIEDDYVNRIVYSFSTNNMPRTPFAVSLILAICSETADYMPTNQAKIVETFLEKILEKLNPSEVLSKTYNFGNKERFLSSLAYEMYKENTYFISYAKFTTFTIDYHESKGYVLSDSKFDTLFFEKGLLVKYNDNVFFRYECLNNYFLAKYCIFNNDYFEKEIIVKNNYLKNKDVISYYAGLKTDDEKLLSKIIGYVEPYFEKYKNLSSVFDVDSIKLQLEIPESEIKDVIDKTEKISDEEKDEITDIPDKSREYNPIQEKKDIDFDESTAFGITVEMLGDVLRSSEELLAEQKQEAFRKFSHGCIIMWILFRKSLLDFAKKINEEIILKEKAKEGCDYNEIKDSLNKAYSDFCDVLKISVPLAMSGFIFDCVGTEKMKKIFTDAYEKADYDSPDKLLLLMLICDLKMNTWNEKIKDYIKNATKKDFLWVLFFKCNYYYRFNYFGEKTDKIKGPMAECFISVNNSPKLMKSKIISEIEADKKFLDSKTG